MKQPRILLLDIETSRSTGKFFGKVYETNIIRVVQQTYILSFAYCWYPSKKVSVIALPDFKGYKKGEDCEEKLLEAVWKLLDEADVVVTQNGNAFDLKTLNARFARHHMQPYKPFKKIDTLNGLKAAFNLPSNKLDFVCDYFSIGRKLPHQGEHMWEGCENGNPASWKMMIKYNAHDVFPLLYGLYEVLRAWMPNHPNLNLIHGRPNACPTCQGTHIQSRGEDFNYTLNAFVRKFRCMDCGKTILGTAREKLDNPIQYKI